MLQQQKAVRSGFFPTYFIQTPTTGFFYPIFAFTGAPASWLAAVIGMALGSGWAAFVLMLALASSASYFGTWWIARICGLSRSWSVLPALLVSMSSYTTADLYDRGDWAELLVVGFVPLLAAGLISLVRNPTAPAWRMACEMFATALVLGSDNAGAIALCVVVLVTALCFLAMFARTRVQWRDLLPAASAAVIGARLDAWYLVPSIVYGHRTEIYQASQSFISTAATSIYDRFVVVLNPALSFIDRSGLHPQLPALVLIWSLAAAVHWLRRPDLRRIGLALCAAIAVLITLLSSDAIWLHLPGFNRTVQFPIRLVPFDGLVITVLFITGLRAIGDHRYWRLTAVLACGVIASLTVYQAWTATNLGWDGHPMTVSANVTPYPFTFGGQQDGFHFPSSHPLTDPPQRVAVQATAHDEFSAPVHPGLAVADVSWSPLLAASGATILGVDSSGFAVVRAGGTRVTFRSQVTPPVPVGLVLTVAALVSIPVTLVAFGGRRRRRPRTG